MPRKKVLQNQKKRRKIILTPSDRLPGPFQDVSWVKTILPELLWIALIQEEYGYDEGVAFITSVARSARRSVSSGEKRIFETISAFGGIAGSDRERLRDHLGASGELRKMRKALRPLLLFYPECPFSGLLLGDPQELPPSRHDLERVKKLVEDLYGNTSPNAIRVQATLIWLIFDSGLLKRLKALSPSVLFGIENYPNIELSQKAAVEVRSSVQRYFEETYDPLSDWPRYFWRRGLALEQCALEESSE